MFKSFRSEFLYFERVVQLNMHLGMNWLRVKQSHIERVLRQLHSLQWNGFFSAMAARGASQKFPEVAANTCSAIEMQQNKPFATHF